MKAKKKTIFLLAIFLLTFSLLIPCVAQEICNNGIDDDGDNRVDCYDTQCVNNAACDGFYLGPDALCQVQPTSFPQFTMTLDFASPNQTANHLGRMAVGDLNRDGTPEIVTMNRYTKRLFLLNGNDGSIQQSVAAVDLSGRNYEPLWEVAIGNIDNDACGEIFFQGKRGDDVWIYAYDCGLNLLWNTRVRQTGGNSQAIDAIEYALADFDADGKVELYLKDMVLDAHTGTIIINSNAADDDAWTNINGGPVAADIMGDSKLEFISGCKIYGVNLGSRAAGVGSLTLLASVPNYYIRYVYNATSVADFNQDGYLDVVASGSTGDGSSGNRKNTTIFFWDVQNNVVDTYSDPIAGNVTLDGCPPDTDDYYARGWAYGTGRINIADLDGDGNLNLSYVSGKYLYALDHNLNQLWRKTVKEETSGYTGCTLFDFNGDGKSEIVYRDEHDLYIINGTDGSTFSNQPCISRTNREYPIVADVDADGSTELCVTCGYNNVSALNNFCNLDSARYSHVRVFKSNSEPWVPARRVWNQHGYFNVNVNDDLTIPRMQQKHHLVWSTGTCTTGPNRPLNGFLNQSPFLNSLGCPIYASPNLAPVPGSLVVNQPTCPNTTFTITFRIQNIGDIALSGNVPISFYDRDPRLAGATKLGTEYIMLSNLDTNDEFLISNLSVTGPGSAFTLYIVLNDSGNDVPTPISLPNTNFLECDYSDNILTASILPIPVNITAVKVNDNLKCPGTAAPDNGAVRAFIPIAGGGENTIDYNFYWFNGATAGLPAAANGTNAIYSGRPAGTYTVYAIHKTANCNSDTTNVVVGQQSKTITVSIVKDHAHDLCVLPNGQLRAIVNGGEPAANFSYEWYRSSSVGGGLIISTGVTASSLIGSKLAPGEAYTVLVTENSSGCSGIQTFYLLDETVKPVPSTSSIPARCSPLNSGSASATVGGVTTGFTFNWYDGSALKPSPDFTGTTYASRTAGNYTVVVINNTSQCASDPVTQNVPATIPPVVTANTTANQTSCDPTLPNGSATSNVGGATSGFTFEWFRGQNTLAANKIAGATNIATALAAGIYTVKATDNITGCSDTEEVTVASNVVIPTIVIGAVANATTCTQPNGSVEVQVSLGTPSEYTFSWYNGTAVKVTPDYTDTDNILNGLAPGSYTVRATHNARHCNASPITATVLDNTPVILIDLDELITVFPSDCNSNNGAMTVGVSAPGNTMGFDVKWYTGRAPFTTLPIASASGVTISSASSLKSGIYSVVATNLNNGCQASDEFNLPFANAHDLQFLSKTDVFKCVPLNAGSTQVRLIPTPLPGFDEADYDIHLYAGANDGGAAIASPVAPPLVQKIQGIAGQTDYSTIATLTPGFYTLVAISKNPLLGNECRSVPVVVEITQTTNNPVLTPVQINNNTKCAGAVTGPDGRIELAISGDGGTSPANYSYTWYAGPDTSSPTLGGSPAEVAQNLAAGTYTVIVTNTNGAANSTGCSTTASYTVLENLPVMSIANADLVVNPISQCNMNNSSASLIRIYENGVPSGSLAGYSLEWLNSSMTLIGSTNPINSLLAGNYFLRVKNTITECATGLAQFEIQDMTQNTVGLDLASFVTPTRCLKPSNLTGELAITPSGNSTLGYTVNWYSGAAVGPPASIIFSGPTLTGITVPAGQPSVTFTAQVINNSNQCAVSATYVLPLDIKPVLLSTSASPLTYCSANNGTAFATVTSGSLIQYNYNWSIGTAVKTIPDSVDRQLTGLAAGDFTIEVVDQSDAFCKSLPQTVSVIDARVYPTPTAVVMAPLTNCDPAKTNGVASASVDGNFSSYRFDWFAVATPTGTPAYTGAEIGNLDKGIYIVRASDLVTGCSGTTQVTIDEALIPVPPVQVEIISHKTSCASNNGVLFASVNGNTQDYIFDWSNGSVVKNSPDFIGERYDDLDKGIYTVIATSKITGCVSAPASAEILEAPLYPDFKFAIIDATCTIFDGGTDGQPDGIVSVIIGNEIDIERIEWSASGTTVLGPVLSNVEAGTYSVTVTTTLGCSTTKSADVKTEIHPFNGISRDGDGRNELFYINCIDNFPNNIVRIYNRAGTLVYEAGGYDNIDIYFDGRSNKGITVIGNNLPDGTYFYVIDKRDGSKPMAGYLEIVN